MKREELIAYDEWLTGRKWGAGEIISPEMAADLYLAEHPLPPAEGAELDHSLDHQHDHPEGAEEILDKYWNRFNISVKKAALNAMRDFATLHAQRLAEKMVEERLREELIAYDKYIGAKGWIDNYEDETAEPTVDEYLKSR